MLGEPGILTEHKAGHGEAPARAMAPVWHPPQLVQSKLAQVELELRRVVQQTDYAWIGELTLHLCQAGGKRLRAVLALLWGHSAGAEERSVVDAAVAVELLHLATLYHDDVIDGASERRGTPSVHRLWGNRGAALAGTLVFAKSLQVLARLGPDANGLASAASAEIWRGQVLESELAFNTDITFEEYYRIIAGKTGALFALACQLGALGRGAGAEVTAGAGVYGSKIGAAFQVMDDIFDLVSEPGSLGKPSAVDLRAGVYTLPTILCLQGSTSCAPRLRSILEDGELTPLAAAEARRIIVESGSLKAARATVVELAAEAVAVLHTLDRGPRAAALEALAVWTVARAKCAC